MVRVCDRAHKNYAQLTLHKQIYKKGGALYYKLGVYEFLGKSDYTKVATPITVVSLHQGLSRLEAECCQN